MPDSSSFNFPLGLNIAPSAPTNSKNPVEDSWQSQAIAEFGIAGRIWEASYLLEQYLQPPGSSSFVFDPPCSIFPPPNPPTSSITSPWPSISSPFASSSLSTFPPQTIIELGAGTGFTSLNLASLLRPEDIIVLTDLDEVVPLMEERTACRSSDSLDGQGGQVLVRGLAWGEGREDQLSLPEGREGKITHLICSDLVYFPFLYPPLLRTLLALTDPNPSKIEIIIAYKVRSLFKETPFWDSLGEEFSLVPVLADGKRFGASDGLGIFVVKRREMGKKREEEVGFEELLFLSMEI
ncbi:putative methyltransferase-domain-containing protein [Mrakia frigida]|uniref:putative methyltransferase-domain-containing protein n=1 Tax=Mrakia frigida TaxID=29902 RepID=UPI003FCC0F51